MFTKDEIDTYKKVQERINDFGRDYVEEFCSSESYFDMAYIEGDRVEIESTSHYCGTSDTDYNSCPIEYLYDEYWIQTEKARLTEVNMKALKDRAERDKQAEIERKASRYDNYLKLKAEYEG